MEVYVLKGTAGKYGDKEIWTLGAFYLMDEAIQKMNDLNLCTAGVCSVWSDEYEELADEIGQIRLDARYACVIYELEKLDKVGSYNEYDLPIYYIEQLEVE